MEILIEAFPFAFGVLLGLTCSRAGGVRKHLSAWAVASVGLGSLATVTSGEWRESLLYFLFDIGLVAGMSIATIAVLEFLRRRDNDAGR